MNDSNLKDLMIQFFRHFFKERTEVTGVCIVSRSASGSCIGGDLDSHAVGSGVRVHGIGI